MMFTKIEKNEKTNNYPVAPTLGMKERPGVVGLEIEVEGSRLLHGSQDLPPGWTYHDDNSLRGAEHAEYIFSKPETTATAKKRIYALFEALRKNKATFDDSNRTSVHVHLNVGGFYLNRLTSLMALHILFEEVLTEWCGVYRVGNLFCARVKDAAETLLEATEFVRSGMQTPFSEGMHYAGMNPSAITSKGSLEFRTLRGTTDPRLIETWLDVLLRMYDKSAEYTDPRDIFSTFSMNGPGAYFEEVFGPLAGEILTPLNLAPDRLRNVLYDGMRSAQELCYCRDWANFKPTPVDQDVFGRMKGKKVFLTPAQGMATPQAPPGGFVEIQNAVWATPEEPTFEE
jgi:hypothetical protein